MSQATEIRRHQESNKTRAKQSEGHDIRDPRTEFAQKQTSIGEQHDEEDGPSSWDPQRHPKMLTNMCERYLHMLISS